MDGKSAIIAVLILLFLAFGYVAIDKIGSLNAKLKESQSLVESLRAEKQLSDDAVSTATSLREQIHEQAREKLKETEKALQDNSSWADILIPDDIRERLFKKDGNCVLLTPSNSSR